MHFSCWNLSICASFTQHDKMFIFGSIRWIRPKLRQKRTLKKLKIFKRSKMDKNHPRDLSNLRKPIFNSSRTNFAQNRILKRKKIPNLPKNTENHRFFEFYKSIKWLELTGKHIQSSGLLEILTKIFLSTQNQKFMKLFKKVNSLPKRALLGGVRLLNVVLRRNHLTLTAERKKNNAI